MSTDARFDGPSALDPVEVNAAVRALFPGSNNECVELGPDFAVARVVAGPDAIRPGGFISGPTQFGLADAVLWYLTFAAVGRIEPMALTSELSMRFLRPAVGPELWARATLEVAGRRNVVGSVRIWVHDEDRPCSIAQGTYALPWPSAT
jgi:acyl-coenzyme A thioesterase PaaI-like protein